MAVERQRLVRHLVIGPRRIIERGIADIALVIAAERVAAVAAIGHEPAVKRDRRAIGAIEPGAVGVLGDRRSGELGDIVAIDQHRRARLVTLARVVGRYVDLDIGIGRPAERHFASGKAGAAQCADLRVGASGHRRHIGARMGQRIVENLDIAIAVLAHARDAHGQVVGQLEIEMPPQINAMIAAIGGFERTGIVALGLHAIELDRPAQRIAPGERALRPAQHFDAVEVHQVEQRAGQGGQIDIVDIHAHARFQGEVGVRLPDAADERDDAGAKILILRGQRHVGGLRRHFGNVGLPACGQHGAIHGSDGQRRILQLLIAELRRHDDFGRGIACRFGGFLRGFGR